MEAYLSVVPGDIVIVDAIAAPGTPCLDYWWMARVIHVIGGAKDPKANSLFQVIDIDTGCVRTINADFVMAIFQSSSVEGAK